MIMVILLFILFLSVLFAKDYPGHVKETLVKISDRLYGVFGVYEQVSPKNRGFISNAYFYVADDGVLVVDALSTYKLGKELVDTVKTVTDKPIRFLVITHYHTDHFYGAKALKEVGAEIVAHEYALEYLANPSSYNFFLSRKKLLGKEMEGTELIPPTVTISKELKIFLNVDGKLKEFQVKHLCKGHTNGDLVVFIPDEGVLFSGDIVFDGRLPFLGSGNSRNWLECLKEISRWDIKLLLPGHGEILDGREKIKKAIEWTAQYIKDLRKAIREMIEEGCDVECVREKINEKLIELNPEYAQVPVFFSVNPVNAYYVYFEIENEMLMEE